MSIDTFADKLRRPARGYIAVLAAASVLYIASCAPGVLWQDSGMTQYRTLHSDIEGGLGLALAHPFFYIIAIAAKYIPFGDVAYKVNLVSAIAGAVTIANLYLLLRLWLERSLPAVVAAATLALSWTFWQNSAMAEVYTVYTALFLAELVCLLQYFKTARTGYLYLLGLFNGLALADHMWAVIPLACYAVLLGVLFYKRKITPGGLAVFVLLWAGGASPYLYLIATNIAETGDVSAVLASAFFGTGWQQSVLNVTLTGRIIGENLLFVLYNFPTPNLLLFPVGLYALYRFTPQRVFANMFLALLILFFAFAFRYKVPDRYAFFIPFYCLVAALMGIGFSFAAKNISRRVLTVCVLSFVLLPIPTYIAAPVMAEEAGFSLGTKRRIPYRNEYRWFLRPWRTGCAGPRRFATEALNSVEPDAIIYADGTTVYALLYMQQVEDLRTDVTVVSGHGTVDNLAEYGPDKIDRLLDQNAVYVVSPKPGYCPQFLLERYRFRASGVLYEVARKTDSQSADMAPAESRPQ